jgi:UDP-N-acetylmuramate--alanine ligase
MAAGVAALTHSAREGDVILTLGAGNVSQASGMLLEALGATDGANTSHGTRMDA